jgi:hypothetical protein
VNRGHALGQRSIRDFADALGKTVDDKREPQA